MGPLECVTILTWMGLSGLLLLAPTVQATVTCTDQVIPAGCNASIVCNFTQDINAGRWDIAINRFPINTTTDDISSRKSVLSCNWGTGNNPQCFLSPDFTSYEISGNVAVVRVASVTKELEGIYRCQPINQDIQITNCKLNVKPAGKCEHERSLVPTNPTHSSSQQETGSAHWRVVAIVVIVLFIIAMAFPMAVFLAHCKHRKIDQFPKRMKALITFADIRRTEAEREQLRNQTEKLVSENSRNVVNLREAKDKLEKKNEDLKADFDRCTKENEDLKADFDKRIKENKADFDKRIKENNADFDRRIKDSGDYEARFRSLTNEHKGLKARFDSLTKKNENLQGRVDSLTNEKKDLQGRVDSLTKDNKELKVVHYHYENSSGEGTGGSRGPRGPLPI